MALELKSIIKNDTWKLVKRPENRDVIGNRIVLRNKYDCNRVLERRKARIVTKSFSYWFGIDFSKHWCPSCDWASYELWQPNIEWSLWHHYSISQWRARRGNLYGNFIFDRRNSGKNIESENSEVERKAAKMLTDLKKEDRIRLLRKILYGLHQADRRWHTKCKCWIDSDWRLLLLTHAYTIPDKGKTRYCLRWWYIHCLT